MKPPVRLLLLGMIFLSIQSLAQNPLNNTSNGNRDDMLWFNLSALNWIEAFDSLHLIMEERYPFTEWKAIDWIKSSTYPSPKYWKRKTKVVW